MKSIYRIQKQSHLEQPMFFGEDMDMQRFDVLKYPKAERMNKTHMGYFWVPEEIDLTKDSADFRHKVSEAGQHIFTSNLKRQIMLDSIQGRGPALTLLPIVSLPEIEAFINTWNFFEGSIHSRSYSHIIRNIYNDPSEVFDNMKHDVNINASAQSIAKYYDDLIEKNANWMAGQKVDLYDHKVALWKCLHAINALEGLRFYVSFACSWSFAENDLMIGNADIIRLIARDENLHLGFTQWLIKKLPEEDSDFYKIAERERDECIHIMKDVMEQEKEWADFLFSKGSILGLNADILKSFVEYLCNKRMRAINLPVDFDYPRSHPLPWVKAWISGESTQDAPQEKEKTDYIVGGIKNDVDDNTFKDFELGIQED